MQNGDSGWCNVKPAYTATISTLQKMINLHMNKNVNKYMNMNK